MALRKPIVQVAGVQQEFDPSVDVLAGTGQGVATPRLLGFNAWSCDPVFCTSNKSLANQDLFVMLTFPSVAVANGGTINVEHGLGAAGATFTYARIGVYFYNPTTAIASLIGTSADLSTVWNSTGNKLVAVTLSQAININDAIYIAVLSNATTAPSLSASPGVNSLGRGTPVRHIRLPGQASLPATITPAGTIPVSVMPYIAY